MKRRLSLVVLLVLTMTLLLTACGPNTTAYLEKMAETEKWEAQEGKAKATIVMEVAAPTITPEGQEPVEVEPMKFEIPFEMDAYVLGQDKGEIKLVYDFSGVKALAPSEEEAAIFPEKFETTIYVDGNKVIMAKTLFTMGMEGMPLPDILEGSEKYIALDMSEFGITMAGEKNEAKLAAEDFVKVLEKAYESYKSDFDMKREGNKFSYELTVEEGKKEITSMIKFTKANIDIVFGALETFIEKVYPENVEEMKSAVVEMKASLAELDDAQVEEFTNETATMLKGSKISEVTEFKEDSYIQKVNLFLNLEGMMKMDMDIDASTKKAAAKEISTPADVKVIKYSEYMESVMAAAVPEGEKEVIVFFNDEFVEFETAAIIEDGRTLVPYRAFLEKLGAGVEWDEENRRVTTKHGEDEIVLTIGSKIALFNGEEIELDKEAKIVDDITLVPLRFISESFGFEVDFEDTPFAYFVNVASAEYTVEIEKMIKEAKAK